VTDLDTNTYLRNSLVSKYSTEASIYKYLTEVLIQKMRKSPSFYSLWNFCGTKLLTETSDFLILTDKRGFNINIHFRKASANFWFSNTT